MCTQASISHTITSVLNTRKCGRLLANFPGSFDQTAVKNILGKGLVQDPSKCLRELQYKSLLSYDPLTLRYRYHQLIKEFFTYISNEYEDSELLNKTFVSHFTDYFASLGGGCVDEKRNLFKSIDAERPNLDFLVSHSLESCPSSAEPAIESLAEFAFNVTNGVLDILTHVQISSQITSLKEEI